MRSIAPRAIWGFLVSAVFFAATAGADYPNGPYGDNAPVPAPAVAADNAPEAPKPAPGWRMLWDDGIRITAPDNIATIKFGGLFQWDAAWDAGDGGPHLADHHHFRFVRPNITGKLTKDIDFRFEADFVKQQVRLTDDWVRLSNIPFIKTVRVGHMKEPICMDQFTSSAYITFPEMPVSTALTPARSFGILAGGPYCDDRMTAFAGVFRNTANWGSRSTAGGEALAFTARVTALPEYEEKGRHLIHVGGAVSFRDPSKPFSFSARPECNLADKLTDTKNLTADNFQLLDAELATVQGPFYATAEFMAANVDRTKGSDLWLDGFYVEAGWFLTGESRPYDRKSGTWGQLKPLHSVTDGGFGAWEISARYSNVDLTGATLPSSARKLSEAIVGVTWYMTRNFKLTVDYGRSHATPSTRDGGLFAVRLQAVF